MKNLEKQKLVNNILRNIIFQALWLLYTHRNYKHDARNKGN